MPTLAELEARLKEAESKTSSIRAKINEQKVQEELEAKLTTSFNAIEKAIMEVVKDKGLPITVLNGKYLSLTVSEIGNLNISLVNKTNGNGKAKAESKVEGEVQANGNGHNGNDKYEYFLKDGQGPFQDIQKAMDALGIDKAKRPQHTRWHRLNKDLQGKIEHREKVQDTVEIPAPEGEKVAVN